MSTSIASFFTVENVQLELSAIAGYFSSALSPATKAVLTTFSTDLQALAQGNISVAAVDTLIADTKVNIPMADQPVVNFILSGALMALNLVLESFGAHNPQVVAYVNAICNGLAAAGL